MSMAQQSNIIKRWTWASLSRLHSSIDEFMFVDNEKSESEKQHKIIIRFMCWLGYIIIFEAFEWRDEDDDNQNRFYGESV